MSYELLKPYTENQKLDFIVQYNHNKGLRIEETSKALYALEENEIMVNDVPVVDPEWDEKQAQKRKQEFLKDFFKVGDYGYYRRQPKGYQSAIESLNTAFNNFVVMQQTGITTFPANIFIFYTEPDFTKPEECTEEWLVAHQYKNEAMTAQEFGLFYTTFTQAWNTEEHETVESEENTEETVTPEPEENTEETVTPEPEENTEE